VMTASRGKLAAERLHAPDVLLPNPRANAGNARLIDELGGSATIVHTDGLEQVTAGFRRIEVRDLWTGRKCAREGP
jgi:hypothetical protein